MYSMWDVFKSACVTHYNINRQSFQKWTQDIFHWQAPPQLLQHHFTRESTFYKSASSWMIPHVRYVTVIQAVVQISTWLRTTWMAASLTEALLSFVSVWSLTVQLKHPVIHPVRNIFLFLHGVFLYMLVDYSIYTILFQAIWLGHIFIKY